MLAHDGFDQRGHPLEEFEGLVCLGLVLEMGEGFDDGVGHWIGCGWE